MHNCTYNNVIHTYKEIEICMHAQTYINAHNIQRNSNKRARIYTYFDKALILIKTYFDDLFMDTTLTIYSTKIHSHTNTTYVKYFEWYIPIFCSMCVSNFVSLRWILILNLSFFSLLHFYFFYFCFSKKFTKFTIARLSHFRLVYGTKPDWTKPQCSLLRHTAPVGCVTGTIL